MRFWINKAVTIDLWFQNVAQQVSGTVIVTDESGMTIQLSDQSFHSYSWSVIQHVAALTMPPP